MRFILRPADISAKVFRVVLNEIWEISFRRGNGVDTTLGGDTVMRHSAVLHISRVWSKFKSSLRGFPRTSLRWCESAPHFCRIYTRPGPAVFLKHSVVSIYGMCM